MAVSTNLLIPESDGVIYFWINMTVQTQEMTRRLDLGFEASGLDRWWRHCISTALWAVSLQQLESLAQVKMALSIPSKWYKIPAHSSLYVSREDLFILSALGPKLKMSPWDYLPQLSQVADPTNNTSQDFSPISLDFPQAPLNWKVVCFISLIFPSSSLFSWQVERIKKSNSFCR